MRALVSIPFVLVIFTGCSAADVSTADVVRTDSAGVRLITSGARDTALAWTFEEIDVFRDSLGEPWLFNGIFTNQVLTDRAGRTYVLTRDPAIVRFGREGRYERTLGRKGGGPGEFEFPVSIGSMGDTIYATDAGKRALVRFGPRLDPVADRRLDGALASAEALAFRTGGLWFRKSERSDSAMSAAVYADTLGGAALQRISIRTGAPVSFGCTGLPAAAPLFSPQLLMTARGPRLLVNAQPAYELWLYEGPRAIASIRRPLAPRVPTEADVRALYPKGLTIGSSGARADCVVPVEEMIAKQGVARQLPLVNDLLLLSDGSMWVQRTPQIVSPGVVDVFGSDGAYLGTVTGMRLPLALLPNGELLVPREDATRRGVVIARVKVRR